MSIAYYLVPNFSTVVAIDMIQERDIRLSIFGFISIISSLLVNVPSLGHFVSFWVVDQHILFSYMSYIVYVFISKIIARKTISIKVILRTEDTFSLRDLSLRGKGPLLVLHVPSMAN